MADEVVSLRLESSSSLLSANVVAVPPTLSISANRLESDGGLFIHSLSHVDKFPLVRTCLTSFYRSICHSK